ncbi:MAG: hypothetical protein K2Q07_07950 [Burkholderiaceae bacterium]|nr:hypothetical protein [Burkholderiaceae bacterium]
MNTRCRRPHGLAWAAALGLAVTVLPAVAQNAPALRDPMVPPLSIARPAANPGVLDATTEPPPTPQQLLTVDGKRYVVDGRRRLGVGDALGGTRIERITDSAVWVRDGHTVTRLPFYGGVTKRIVVDAPPAAATLPHRRTSSLSPSPTLTKGELP